MKNEMLKRLKLGICSFDDFHFAIEKSKNTQKTYTDFVKIVAEHLSDTKLSDELLFQEQCRKLFINPSVVHILSDKFSLSHKHLMAVTSSPQFLQIFLSTLNKYPVQERSRNEEILSAFAETCWQIFDEIFEWLNYYQNLDLLQRNFKLWIEVFNFLCDRCCQIKKIPITERALLPNCSFPFSWIIYLHLQQIAKIKRHSVCSDEKKSISNFKFLGKLLEYQSEDYEGHLLDDCLKIATYESNFVIPMVEKPIMLFNRKIAIESIEYLLIHCNFLACIAAKCSTPEDIAFAKEMIGYQIGSVNNDHYCSGVEVSTSFQKDISANLLEFIYFHFVQGFTAKTILLKKLQGNTSNCWDKRKSSLMAMDCESNCPVPIFCTLSKLLNPILEVHSPLKTSPSDNSTSGLLLQKTLGALFALYETFSYSDKDLSAACVKALFSVQRGEIIDREMSRDIFLASSELSTTYLVKTFLLKGMHQAKQLSLKNLLDCLSSVQSNDESHIFTTVIQKVLYKRLIENNPKELLNLITSGSGLDVVCMFSDPHSKLLCVKSLVNEFGLQILEELRLKAGCLFEMDIELRQTTDYFNILGHNYISTRSAISEDCPNFAFEPVNVMLSYFQSRKSGISDEEYFLYLNCIKNTLEHDQSQTLLDLDNGYLFGIPSSDWKSNKDLVFLTYTYLTRSTSSSALSKLLKYIYLFPIRSDNMFLPTMREDVVSKFRATLGEKFAAQGHQLYTWYKCAGGHVYAINNCGEPQEKGKCFCGGEIGGMKHTLSKGNQRLESYKFSEKGYNLPPVGFLSSVDSERNLKSLALSFMRWLIHASLAVSPKITSCGKVFGLNDKDDVTSYLQQRLENDFTGIQTTLGKNTEDTQIWMITAIKHVFLHTDTFDLDYSEREGRNQLEDVYLETISPLIESADEVIAHGKELVHKSDDEYIRQVLGLSYPENGPGLLDCPEYLKKSMSVAEKLNREFRKSGSVKNHPTVNKFITNMSFLDILYLLPDLIKTLCSTIHKVNFKITKHESTQLILKDFIDSSELQLWNDLWLKAKSMTSFVDNIYLPEEYSDRILTMESKLTDFIPYKDGPGICSWFLINNLLSFYNQFAQGPVINILSLTDFVTPSPVPNYELVALMYDAYDGSSFNFNLLEECFVTMFCIQSRCRIDTESLTELLFCPLKCEDTWYKALKQLPKESRQTVQENLDTSPETLRAIEIVMQISSSTKYDTLSVAEISGVFQLNLPESLKKTSLYSCWHYVWFQLSVSNGKFYLPPESQKRAEKFLKSVPPSEFESFVEDIPQSAQFIKILHMMIVEWIVNNPGFDCTGMLLTEALDFFCEQAGVAELDNVLELCSTDLKVECSIACLEFLLSRIGDL